MLVSGKAQSGQNLALSRLAMSGKLLTEHHFVYLSLKDGCTGSSESIHVKIPHRLEITCRGSNLILTSQVGM